MSHIKGNKFSEEAIWTLGHWFFGACKSTGIG